MNYFDILGNILLGQRLRLVFFLGSLLILKGPSEASGPEGAIKNRPVQLAPGDTLRIALRDAILLALDRNPAFTIQQLEPGIARTFVDEQRAAFDPEVAASATHEASKTERRLGTDRTPFDLKDDRRQYDVEISQTLPTGTTISANASMSSSISSFYTDQFTGRMGLTITQALLQGFGTGVNLANLRKAKIDVDISKAELKAVADQVVANVEKAYWDLFLAAEEINIQRKSLELANRQLQESLERVSVGKLPELELAAVRAEVATRQGILIEAQSKYEQARLHFLFLLNPSTQFSWSTKPLPVDKPFIPDDSLDDITVHEQLGMKYRSDLQQTRLALEKGELDIELTRNGLLPRLDLFIALGRTSYARTFSEAIPDLRSPFYDVSAGLLFVFPIPNRKARAQVARARWSQAQLELSVKNMERLIQRDVRSAYIEVLSSRQQIEATRVARRLQEQKLKAEQEKFRVGRSTNFLVLQAQGDFTTSQLDEARSIVFYLNALVNLYFMEGTLLERRGLSASLQLRDLNSNRNQGSR